MKVVLLCQLGQSLEGIGGADIHINNIIENLSSISDIELHVVTMKRGSKNDHIKKENNVTYHILGSPKISKTIAGLFIQPTKLMKRVQEINPDIIHAQVLGAPYGLVAMKLSKKYPTVLTVHTIVALDTLNRTHTIKSRIHDTIWKYYEKREIKKIPNLIAVSNTMNEELKKRGARNVWTIRNGISDNWFQVHDNEVNGRILFVGRIIPIKGLDVLLRSFKIVQEKVGYAQLHFVGPILDNKYHDKLAKMINDLDLQDTCNLLGPKEGTKLEREYSEASVFVLPSERESNPIVLLEAMASGKPIVATTVGGIPEIITDGLEGFLVEYGNHEELAKKILILLSDNNMREKMGNSGKQKVRNYTWINIAKQTCQVYEKAIESFNNR